MTTPRYDVVAMSLPVVYTREGDHDPDGLILTLAAYRPLLEWVRARWEEDDHALPRLHLRAQHAQVVVDGLELLEPTLERLSRGPESDQDLLAALIREESVVPYPEAEDRDRLGSTPRSPREAAVSTNVRGRLEDLRFALAQLAPAGDEEVAGLRPTSAGEPAPALVTLAPAQRAALRTHWVEQLHLTTAALRERQDAIEADPARRFDAAALAAASGLSADRVRQLMLNDHRVPPEGLGIHTPDHDRVNVLRPLPVVRPLVLRARRDEPLRLHVHNSLSGRAVDLLVQGHELSGPTRCEPGEQRTVDLTPRHEGVWPVNDVADVRGSELGSNAHGLFAALVVEAPGSTWSDPETGEDRTYTIDGDGLYLDVHPAGEDTSDPRHAAFVDFHLDDVPRSFREFTVFLHDEPEIHGGLHGAGEHTVMPLSYRAEPMPNRLPHRMRRYVERTPAEPSPSQHGVDRTAFTRRLGAELEEEFWTARTPDGQWLEQVAGEEQHHSSWLFGEPVTPVLRAYRGDPARIRLVHAGVKETHVFHLHVHQWRAVPQDTAPPSQWEATADGTPPRQGSQLLDSTTIGPQTATTIDPLYGSGSRQHAPGDIIWHCHLYPHFHHGMWGLWRSHDREVDGTRAYPDGTPCAPLVPLPGRPPAPSTPTQPGFPWFVDGDFPMKSPPPPALLDEHVGGRRRLLGLPRHAPSELAAFADGCRARPRPGALFVPLDDLAAQWNAEVGLPAPRIVSYDVEVRADDTGYNRQGWHDPVGHHYRLLHAEIRQTHPDGTETLLHEQDLTYPLDHNPEPFFPRANHGDIVELRLHNALGTFPADRYDLAQAPVECGLHVHLVKFDPLAADGSATGWNYLSGGSCREAVGSDTPGQPARNVSLHRWVVDEEFGPCFFHDHLLANFRQKHGLFAALVAEPFGSQWHTVDQERTAFQDPLAVIVPHPATGVPPFREAGLAVGDFVPLLDEGGRPLNPPGSLSGDDDPGSMAVNYRSTPMTFRGPDPSTWFSTEHDPGAVPDTPTVWTYAGDRLRIRLIQGSHEEQHGFTAHGLRWRRDWHRRTSTLVDHQTIGISEAFTLDVDPRDASPYGTGDHLWRFAAVDDTWLGCWGLVRSLPPTGPEAAGLPRLPVLGDPADAPAPVPPLPDRPSPDEGSVRTFVVVAQRHEHRYQGAHLTDPYGLIFRVAGYDADEHAAAATGGVWEPGAVDASDEPLVLRARRGEWVRVFVVNDLRRDDDEDDPTRLRWDVELNAPRLPLEHLDDLGRPDARTLSSRVSLHPHLLRHDVVSDDGTNVGGNPDQTVAAREPVGSDHGAHEAGRVVDREAHAAHARRNWTEHWWYADPDLAPASAADGPGQVCLLEDLADVRNHRHHGLFGALVVEPGDVTPTRGDGAGRREAWSGVTADLRDGGGDLVASEVVVFLQDGLRLFVNGHPELPAPDVVPDDDPEDSGSKAISYRTALVHRGRPPAVDRAARWRVRADHPVWVRAVCAGDKPRQHTLVLHGGSWAFAPWQGGATGEAEGPWVGSESGLCNGWVRDLVVPGLARGDHALRSGAFRWGTELGMWSTLQVR